MSEQGSNDLPVHESYRAERATDPHAEPPLESLKVEQETAEESEGADEPNGDNRRNEQSEN
jgi:hypothetical protein